MVTVIDDDETRDNNQQRQPNPFLRNAKWRRSNRKMTRLLHDDLCMYRMIWKSPFMCVVLAIIMVHMYNIYRIFSGNVVDGLEMNVR